MKWLRCLLALALMLVGVQLVAANSSYAASDYDGVIKTGGDLSVSDHYSGGICDGRMAGLGNSWASILGESSSYAQSGLSSTDIGNTVAAFNAAMAAGKGYALVQETVQNPGTMAGNSVPMDVGSTYLIAYFSDNSTATFQSGYNGPELAMKGSWYRAYVAYKNVGGSCVVGVTTAIHMTYDFYGVEGIQSSAFPQDKAVFINFDVSYPTGYAGQYTSIMWLPTYVAMGDSFSSGEGNPPFEYGTDTANTDLCHRSSAAYPRLLQNDASLNLGSTAFVACSGATTSTVLNGGSGPGSWGEGPQTHALTASTQVVTITIGGNDIGFSDFGQACVLSASDSPGCDSTSSAYATTMGKIVNDLPYELKDTYETILQLAPNAKVYVVDYPQVVPTTGMEVTDPEIPGCYYLYNGSTNWGNGRAARDVVSALDSAISNEVAVVQQENSDYASRLHYVPSNGTSSPFVGHTVCDTGNSYFQNLDQALDNAAYVFHPNANGHVAYEGLVHDAVE